MPDRARGSLAALLAVLMPVVIVAPTATPAHAIAPVTAPASAAVQDALGDVVTDLAAATATTTGNVDVRALAVRLLPRKRAVRARLSFTDLTPAGAGHSPALRHQILLLVHHGPNPDRAVVLERGPWPPKVRTYVEHSDGRRTRCPATSRVNLKRDVIRIDVPVHCLRRGARRVRLSAVSAGFLVGSAADPGTWVGTDLTRLARAIRLR